MLSTPWLAAIEHMHKAGVIDTVIVQKFKKLADASCVKERAAKADVNAALAILDKIKDD
ncbi:hypothetical protein [Piscirickettsia salmonis]|uniref:hypothetical protein n=1 Tax=Piscirickettsia salmonis TaxID=1238 RepID=UPI0012B7ECCF|nr:hypothetical protein [Piscirickettsia salmonis]